MSGGGDSYYINEARRIQDNIQQLLLVASELGSGNEENGGWLKSRLSEAKVLAHETHQLLKGFSVIASESSANSTERFQRRDTCKKLNRRYQSALKALDEAAQSALRSNRSSSYPPASNSDLNSNDPLNSLYPESAMAAIETSDVDDLSSQASSSRIIAQRHPLSVNNSYPGGTGWDDEQLAYRKRVTNNEFSRSDSRKLDKRTTSETYIQQQHSFRPIYPNKYRSVGDFYCVAQPQIDLMESSYAADSPYHVIPLQQPIFSYQPRWNSSTLSNESVALELNDTTVGASSPATTTAGTLRTQSMADPRDLDFYSVRMVPPDELRARLLAEESRGVMQIEKDVKGIRELYQEMAWQVTNEADDLDAIETQIRTANDLSSSSTVDIGHANRWFQAHGRLKLYLAGGLAICFVIITTWIVSKISSTFNP